MVNQTSILIVEDELIIAADLRRQLQKLGYHIQGIVTAVDEAREQIKLNQPDLVLLDIKLHGNENGTVLGKELRAKGNIPFIYITSHFDRSTVEEAKATRPNGYLIKPFGKEDVYVAIEMAMMNFAHKEVDENIVENERSKENAAPAKIKKVVAYMNDNLHKKLTLPDLAKETDWNVYHFARIFKKYLNDSPYNYLLKIRMEKAKTILATTGTNISEIAMELGFDNHSHFSQTFRKLVGISPDAYRQKMSKSQ